MSLFGATLLLQARQRVRELPPAAEGQHPDEPLATATSKSLDEVRRALGEFPEYQHVDAVQLMISGMVMEHLRLSTTTPRARQRN